jgi:hypothetical protein
MNPRPAALYLTHFDVASVPHPLTESLEVTELAPHWALEHEEDTLPARLAEAREEGRAEAAAAAEQRAAADLQRLQVEHETHLAAERQKWRDEEASILQDRLGTALRRIEDDLAECVARILRPFIIESLRRQMIGELVEHVGTLVASHDMMAIMIAGPPDLIAVLQEKLAGLPIAIAYNESDGVDVRVTAEKTMIETRLKAWIDLIAAKME